MKSQRNTSPASSISAFILAGEASGDRLAARLMDAGGQVFEDISWFGVGGPKMDACGLEKLADMEVLSIIGFGDALRHLRALTRLADELIDAILARQPEYIFTIDSKGFSLRFAKRLRRALEGRSYQPKLVHMVAPTVWAWGAWRAKKFGQLFDHIFCLFPFEVPFFASYPAKAVFVGHPDADGKVRPMPDRDRGIHILLLPGSRAAEIARHLPLMLAASERLLQNHPDLRFSLPLLPHLHKQAAPFLAKFSLQERVNLNDNSVDKAFERAHFIIASSGTVTLEAAIAGVPGVVIYHLSWINRIFAKLFFKPKTPVLPDIILGTRAYPFLIPPDLSAENIALLAEQNSQDITAKNAEIARMSKQLKSELSPDGQPFDIRLVSALRALSS